MAATWVSTILIYTIAIAVSISIYQQPQAQQPPNETCNDIFVSYIYNTGFPLPPTLLLSDPTHQPYRFQSFLTVLNMGLEELKSWRVFVGFQHGEYLVSASHGELANGDFLPANVSGGAVIGGSSLPDLKTAVQTAGDWNQMRAQIELVGTQFGIGDPDIPMPASIALANDGFFCPNPIKVGNKELQLCCTKDPNARPNSTVNENFAPIQNGDITIMYDVIKSYDTDYWAQVTISNNNPISRLDNWQLSWDWMRDEFINSMKGAYTSIVHTTDCLFGPQGQHYLDMDFSTVLNCERRPTIIDLSLEKTNDTNLGLIPFCCRNGTLLPPSMDPTKSKSAFLMHVYKMPPYLNRTELSPPRNWQINSTINVGYQCQPPLRVSQSLFPDLGGLPTESTAIASWQVVCNLTKPKDEKPKCCVSFSAFYNDSLVPCSTCACGCNNNNQRKDVCSDDLPAILLPSQALLVPFDNRTKLMKEWANQKKQTLPNPLPCGDNCGVSINWHVLSDFEDGWTARLTLFNWGDAGFADWFAAVQLDEAMPGFEAVYSFNGSVLPNDTNTMFLKGLPGLNFLLPQKDGAKPRKDFPVPGTQQSVISFNKKKTPGIEVARGDGFPTKVYFNGEECSLPYTLPSSSDEQMRIARALSSFLLASLLLLLFQN